MYAEYEANEDGEKYADCRYADRWLPMLELEYYKVEEVKNINKDKLKEDLEGGKTIEGAYLHRTESLIIK